jgi:hypothetical protein
MAGFGWIATLDHEAARKARAVHLKVECRSTMLPPSGMFCASSGERSPGGACPGDSLSAPTRRPPFNGDRLSERAGTRRLLFAPALTLATNGQHAPRAEYELVFIRDYARSRLRGKIFRARRGLGRTKRSPGKASHWRALRRGRNCQASPRERSRASHAGERAVQIQPLVRSGSSAPAPPLLRVRGCL